MRTVLGLRIPIRMPRELPRKFESTGKGWVTGETSVRTPYRGPTIQLLKYESGEKATRFCGYEDARMGRYPLVIGEEIPRGVGKAGEEEPAAVPNPEGARAVTRSAS